MKFVENILFERETVPAGIVPVAASINDLRRPVDTSWLIPRRRIGSFLFTVKAIPVEGSGRNAFHNSVEISTSNSLHGNDTLSRFDNAYVNLLSTRSPYEKTACVLAHENSAKSFIASRSHVRIPRATVTKLLYKYLTSPYQVSQARRFCR